MNISLIIRNSENQVAVALRNKVDQFIKAKKNRLKLLVDIQQLSEDLKNIVTRAPSEELWVEAKNPPKQEPLPPKDRNKETT